MKIAVVGLGNKPSSRSQLLLASLLSLNLSNLEARYMSLREYEETRKCDTYYDECLGFDPKSLSYFVGVEKLSDASSATTYGDLPYGNMKTRWAMPTLRKPKPYYQRGRW